MSVRKIEAMIDCDGCCLDFTVELDPADSSNCIFDTVLEVIRGGYGGSSYQHDLMLCSSCTNIVDNIGEESYRPTKEEIESVLAEQRNVNYEN